MPTTDEQIKNALIGWISNKVMQGNAIEALRIVEISKHHHGINLDSIKRLESVTLQQAVGIVNSYFEGK